MWLLHHPLMKPKISAVKSETLIKYMRIKWNPVGKTLRLFPSQGDNFLNWLTYYMVYFYFLSAIKRAEKKIYRKFHSLTPFCSILYKTGLFPGNKNIRHLCPNWKKKKFFRSFFFFFQLYRFLIEALFTHDKVECRQPVCTSLPFPPCRVQRNLYTNERAKREL